MTPALMEMMETRRPGGQPPGPSENDGTKPDRELEPVVHDAGDLRDVVEQDTAGV
jgi:hypothetical protein